MEINDWREVAQGYGRLDPKAIIAVFIGETQITEIVRITVKDGFFVEFLDAGGMRWWAPPMAISAVQMAPKNEK